MAKKKKEEKETKKESGFDAEQTVLDWEIPVWMKSGFLYYIEINKLTFKSEKDLEKEYTKFLGE